MHPLEERRDERASVDAAWTSGGRPGWFAGGRRVAASSDGRVPPCLPPWTRDPDRLFGGLPLALPGRELADSDDDRSAHPGCVCHRRRRHRIPSMEPTGDPSSPRTSWSATSRRSDPATAVEIEAKFLLPDEETLERLVAVPCLAGFELGPPRTLLHRDTYLDTADRRLEAAGWVCRVRRREGEPAVVTLKSRTVGEEGIMRREERNLVLPRESLEPARWPSGPFRETVLALAAGRPLVSLACLWQRRTLRTMTRPPLAHPRAGGGGIGPTAHPDRAPSPPWPSSAWTWSMWSHLRAGPPGIRGWRPRST